MKIEIAGSKIKIVDFDSRIANYCKINLTLDNPDYYKKERLGKWTGNTPKQIMLYEKNGNELWLPFGCVNDLHDKFKDAQWSISMHNKIGAKYNSSISTYSYQESAIQAALAKKNGILVMPCGSGKTQAALEFIKRIGGKCLWLTHTQDLLNQSRERAESVLECIGGRNGKITAGKVDIGTHITFATVQTMARLDLSKYRDCFDIVIVDECQHCCGTPTQVTQFYKVVSSISARYKIGLTATPRRADGLEKSMFALLGNIIYEVTKDQVKQTTCQIEVKQVKTGYTPNSEVILMGDGTINYAALVDDMINDEVRKSFVLSYINSLGGKMIVLANRVKYISELHKGFSGKSVCLSILGLTKKAREERKEALRKLDNGEIDAIFATYQLAKEGLDVPSLNYVVFATPEKDETTIVQSAGRVGRKSPGKEKGTVIDFVDDFGMYIGWAKKRRSHYKKIDAKVLED